MLERRGLDIDALSVVHLTLNRMVKPSSRKKAKGSFVDESFSGGVLMTEESMMEAIRAKAERKKSEEQLKVDKHMSAKNRTAFRRGTLIGYV
jgi:hypothetical protein